MFSLECPHLECLTPVRTPRVLWGVAIPRSTPPLGYSPRKGDMPAAIGKAHLGQGPAAYPQVAMWMWMQPPHNLKSFQAGETGPSVQGIGYLK